MTSQLTVYYHLNVNIAYVLLSNILATYPQSFSESVSTSGSS